MSANSKSFHFNFACCVNSLVFPQRFCFTRSTGAVIDSLYLCIHQVQGPLPQISHILFWIRVH